MLNRLRDQSQFACPPVFPVSLFVMLVVLLTSISDAGDVRKRSHNLDDELKLNGAKMRQVFAPAVKAAHASTVELWSNGKQVALGTVLDDEGTILSKASELQSEIHCRFPDGKEVRARLQAIDRKYDLALLHVDCDELTPAVWSKEDLDDVGRWVITSGIEETPVAVGVSSVKRINIPRMRGRGKLGVIIDENEKRPTILSITPFSAASRCGLQPGDVILQMADRVVNTTDSWNHTITRYHPGDTFFMRVIREGTYLNIQVTLDRDMSKAFRRQAIQNRMGAPLSTRRAGFDNVLQHDSVLAANQCGGPLVNLKGEIIGINIARGGRTESYAIPVSAVRERVEELSSGRLDIVLPDHRLPDTELLVSRKTDETRGVIPPPPPLVRD